MIELSTRALNYSRIIGSDGWQYMSGLDWIDEKNAGARRLSEDDIRRWSLAIEMRKAWCASHGIDYVFMVAPNKATVYPEFMPAHLQPQGIRDVTALKTYMATSPASFYDPLDDLLDEKRRQDVYYKTDEHWNYHGAYRVYRELIMDIWKRVPGVKPIDDDRVMTVVRPFMGGLEILGDDPKPEIVDFRLVRDQVYKRAFENKPTGRGKVEVLINEERPNLPTAVMFRDSFGTLLMPYLKETFSRITVVASKSVLCDLVLHEKPDVVIHEMVERYLDPITDERRGSEDIRAKTFEEYCEVPLSALP